MKSEYYISALQVDLHYNPKAAILWDGGNNFDGEDDKVDGADDKVDGDALPVSHDLNSGDDAYRSKKARTRHRSWDMQWGAAKTHECIWL